MSIQFQKNNWPSLFQGLSRNTFSIHDSWPIQPNGIVIDYYSNRWYGNGTTLRRESNIFLRLICLYKYSFFFPAEGNGGVSPIPLETPWLWQRIALVELTLWNYISCGALVRHCLRMPWVTNTLVIYVWNIFSAGQSNGIAELLSPRTLHLFAKSHNK